MTNLESGKIIATESQFGMSLNKILYIDVNDDLTSMLYCETLYDDKMRKSEFNNHFSILIPEQEDTIVPIEKYFDKIQNEINEKQQLLNTIKEQYGKK